MPSMKVTYKPARRSSSPAQKVLALQQLALEYAQKVQALDLQATDTWDHQPDFPIEDVSGAGDLTFNVRAQGANEPIFRFVNEGTDKRYAVMTPGFVAKSQVGVIGSGAGSGGFSHFDFKNPRSGIQAREFDKEIVNQLKDSFVAEARKIIRG